MLVLFFFRPAVILLAICALLCLIVPVFGARPLEANEAWQNFGFDTCDLPCFSGMTPGRTSFQNAPDLLRQNVPLVGNRMFDTGTTINFWASNESQELAGVARYEQGMIDDLRLTAPLPVDHLVAQLGTPDCIVPSTAERPHSTMRIYWIREGVAITAILDQPTFNMHTKVLMLWLRTVVEPNPCLLEGTLPWRGFAPAWKYTD